MRSKLWYILAIVACALLPLAGCSGGGSQVKQTQKGVEVTVGGKVDVSKATAKSAFLNATSAGAINNVFVYNAQDGAQLGTAAIGTDGSFSNLSFTLPAAKTVLVFKAIVAQGTFRSLVPVDLSNPPAAGAITASQPINIVIGTDSNNIVSAVSAMLGITGYLGDTGKTLASVTKTYTDCATEVANAGGQILAYSTNGLALSGTVSSASLLPAKPAAELTYDDLINTKLDGKVISAYVPQNKAIVNFQVTNKATGKGISGLKTFGLHVAVLKDGTTWLDYKLEPQGAARDREYLPGADTGSTIIDHGDGSYTAVLGTDLANSGAHILSMRDDATKNDTTNNPALTLDKTQIHRIGITVSSAAPAAPINPATGAAVTSFTPPNVTALVYDFIPETGLQYVNPNGGNYARDIVTMEACDACHGTLVNHGHHFGSRPDTKICVICHTVQNKRTGIAACDFTSFIHKIHMGEELPVAETVAGIDFHEITYPQTASNCATCHKGKDGNNWKTKPSRNACGSCHNDVTWTSHEGGQTSDASCAGCHTGGIANVEIVKAHIPVQAPDPTSPEWGGTNTHTYAGYLPAAGIAVPGAAVVSWDVKSVAVTTDNHPSITFRFIKDGAPVVFNTFGSGATELMNGFTGSPSAYFAFAVTQDGIPAPADFNATASAYIKKVWNGTTTTSSLTGPDTNGYYTLTINNVLIPTGAKMVTGGIGYTYGSGSTPLTQTNLSAYPYTSSDNRGGLIVVTPNVWKVATGYTGRRAIVSNAKCNACHAALGIAPTFHSGQRNDAPTCGFCHNVNRVNNGWGVNTKEIIHSIHGGSKRTNKFSWEAGSGYAYWEVTYPGVLRNCEQCHVAGSYDFSATASRSAVDSLLPTTVATGTTPVSIQSIVLGTETLPGTYYSPFVAANTAYGAGFSFTGSTGTTTEAASTTLIVSPITAACFSCHDTKAAIAHMKQNGGAIYEARSTALGKTETCLVCHGPRGADTTLPVTGAVPTIKTVHRWW